MDKIFISVYLRNRFSTFLLFIFFLLLPLALMAAPSKKHYPNAAEIEKLDEADARLKRNVDLIYVGEDYNVYVDGEESGQVRIMLVHDVGYDELLVPTWGELTPGAPEGSSVGLKYDKDFTQKIVDIVKNNSGIEILPYYSIGIFHYVRGIRRPHHEHEGAQIPYLTGGMNPRNGDSHFWNPHGNIGFLTVNSAVPYDKENGKYWKDMRRNQAIAKERIKAEKIAAEKRLKQRLADAAAARQGKAITSPNPPTGDDIADAYINEALRYKMSLKGDRTLYAKGTNAGVTVKSVDIHQCQPAKSGYRCKYTLTQDQHIDAGTQKFAKIFGLEVPKVRNIKRNDLFEKTAAGWRSPTYGESLRLAREKNNRERRAAAKKAGADYEQWYEDATSLW
ncbi:MAG: hypothetical protein AB2747_21785 [Candidatus Thiodiazotropha taylori]